MRTSFEERYRQVFKKLNGYYPEQEKNRPQHPTADKKRNNTFPRTRLALDSLVDEMVDRRCKSSTIYERLRMTLPQDDGIVNHNPLFRIVRSLKRHFDSASIGRLLNTDNDPTLTRIYVDGKESTRPNNLVPEFLASLYPCAVDDALTALSNAHSDGGMHYVNLSEGGPNLLRYYLDQPSRTLFRAILANETLVESGSLKQFISTVCESRSDGYRTGAVLGEVLFETAISDRRKAMIIMDGCERNDIKGGLRRIVHANSFDIKHIADVCFNAGFHFNQTMDHFIRIGYSPRCIRGGLEHIYSPDKAKRIHTYFFA